MSLDRPGDHDPAPILRPPRVSKLLLAAVLGAEPVDDVRGLLYGVVCVCATGLFLLL